MSSRMRMAKATRFQREEYTRSTPPTSARSCVQHRARKEITAPYYGEDGERCRNGRTISRRARLREASASNPPMKCPNRIRRCQNRVVTLLPGSARGEPESCPNGIRHVGGAKLNEALVCGTCRSDAKADIQTAHTRGRASPKATSEPKN